MAVKKKISREEYENLLSRNQNNTQSNSSSVKTISQEQYNTLISRNNKVPKINQNIQKNNTKDKSNFKKQQTQENIKKDKNILANKTPFTQNKDKTQKTDDNKKEEKNKKVSNNSSVANNTPFTDKSSTINKSATGKIQDKKEKPVVTKKTKSKSDATLLDFLGGIGKTAVTTAGILGEGVVKGGEMFVDAGATVIGKFGNDEFKKGMSNFIKRDLTNELMTTVGWTDAMKKQMDDNSLIKRDNLGGTVTKEIGKMLPTLLVGGGLSGASKGIQTVVNYGGVGARSMGGSMEEALNEGANFDDATKYAVLSSATEIATEWVTGGIPGLKGTAGGGLDKLVAKSLGDESFDQMSKSLAKSLIKSGYKIVGEGSEEALAEMINPYLKNATYSQGEKINWDEVVESAIVGSITSGILNAPSSIADAKQSINKNSLSPNEQIVLENVSQVRYSKVIEENNNISKEEQNNLRQKIEQETKEDLENGNLTIDEIESSLGGETYNEYKTLNNQKEELQNKIDELSNTSMKEITLSEYNSLNSKITDLEKQLKEINAEPYRYQLSREMNEKIKNDSILQRSYREANERNKPYTEKEKSDNEKINKLRESATNYLDNSTKSHQFVDTISKVIEDKNYSVVFDDALTTKDGNVINAQVTNTDNGVEIKINPNSERAGEFLLAHEITHAIETDSMKQLVMDYASKNKDFNTALDELKKTYQTKDVSDEVLADISGQLFGNQEFINELSIKQPNVFKKIYNKIIELANKITGNSKESLFIKDLKNKWQEAYISKSNNLDKVQKYSIQQDSNGNKFVNVDTNQDIFKGKTLVEQTKVAKKYILDNFRENGIYMNFDNVNVTSKTANEYTHPRNQLSKATKESKMKASTELDNLIKVSKYSHSAKDDGRHPFAKDGWDYYKTTFKVGNETFEGLVNIGKNDNKKTLYDITNIKRISQNRSTSANAFSTSLANSSRNNISNSNENVKSNISTKYSMQNNENNSKWQEHLETNYKSGGTTTDFKDIKTQTEKVIVPLQKEIKEMNKTIVPLKKEIEQLTKELEETKKTLNPVEISQLPKEEASTTPTINTIKTTTGEGKSHFFDNIKDKVDTLTEASKAKILSDDEVKYYKEVTNEDSLNNAFKRLYENGANETRAWFNKKSEHATDVDVAEGWILMKQYEDVQDYDGMVQVAKKMRDIGSKAGQTVQAFNIMNRLTPEGMVKYAQSELTEAYEQMVKNKTKSWIDKHRADFELKPNETSFIVETMNEVKNMEDGYDKKVKLAEIQKILTDKLPPERGQGIKAWMRISMLFNPKTQVRNVLGNALIAPVNSFGDLFASGVDKLIASKTGVRTTGITSIKNYGKGIKQGLFQSYNDFKKGINTRNLDGNRFEVGEGRSFNNNTAIGKGLNKVDNLLSFMLDAGDRMFYEGSFVNSINNQMILNKTDEVTQDMIDIATNEALSRTWQDNNKYTQFVLNIRKGLNNVNVKGYGLGDVLIPFAKTPANLTKALIDYSPAGLITTLVKGKNLKNSLETGQYNAKIQHDFVQSLGKATAGTMLYVLGYALAKSGVISGESDDDKDTANFMKNTIGVNSYSIKIGDKSFTYDWAQPLAGPFSMMANLAGKENQEKTLTEKIISTLDTGGNVIFEQSFMESINTVLNNNDGVATGIKEAILELPSRAVPTIMRQITDLTDGTQRTTFEYDKPLDTAVNKIKSKIPGLSKTLAPTVDTLGREIQKYGGKNNLFNVFLNPANVTNDNVSESAKEIYRLYKETGDKTIMPRVAPYYINNDGEKIILTSEQREKFQKQAGQTIEDSVSRLMNISEYMYANDEEKADIINGIVGYSYNIAQHDEVGTEISQTYQKVNDFVNKGGDLENFYIYKNGTQNMGGEEKADYLYNSEFSSNQKTLLYENVTLSNFDDPSKHLKYKASKELGIDIDNWLNYSSQTFESLYNSKGQTIKNSKRDAIINFVNSLDLSIPQKASLIKMSYSSYKKYDNQIMNYIDELGLDYLTKAKTVKSLGFKRYNNSIINYVRKHYSSIEKQSSVLNELGFKVYQVNGKTYVR